MSWEAQRNSLVNRFRELKIGDLGFDDLALKIFRFQSQYNKVYKEFLNLLGTSIPDINQIGQIPALPIQLYKTCDIKSFPHETDLVFESSRTTGMKPSRHYVGDERLYNFASTLLFEDHFGRLEDFQVVALLPTYLERQNSSLVHMVNLFVEKSSFKESGFFLYDFDSLNEVLSNAKANNVKTILFGVSFALLDFFEFSEIQFPELIIIETGGMKGRKKELMKTDIIHQIRENSGSNYVFSEYGMTELLSQFYAMDGIHFEDNRFAKGQVMQINDPLSLQFIGKAGFLKIIDLSNIDSCSFILTEDIAVSKEQNEFEILGRGDASDIRGCNLLYTG